MGAKGIAVDDFAQAIKDVLEGNQTAISHTEARDIVNKYFAELEEKMNAANIEAGKKFLEENKNARSCYASQRTSIRSYHRRKRRVTMPKQTDQVQCHYEGTLIDGTLFDSSIKRGQPATFGVNQVIPGWVEALQLMPEGARWKLYIPSGPGIRGAGCRRDDSSPQHARIEVELQKFYLNKQTVKANAPKWGFQRFCSIAGMVSLYCSNRKLI